MEQDPLREGSLTNKIMLAIRKRKGLKEETPLLSNFADKL